MLATPEYGNIHSKTHYYSLLYAGWSRNCKKPLKAFPYAWPVFFWLTASERLDRLPQVFAASSNRTIRS